jgi:hypothetical protein
MCNNNLADLYGINYLKSLRNLILRENYINKLDNIDNLNHLSFLDLSNNVLRNIDKSNIGFLPNLKTLICNDNYLKNVNAFNKLITLFYLSFENNKITDFNHIDKLNQLECLKELNLTGCPITKEYGYRFNIVKRFMNLNKIDNLEITKDEREMILLELQGLNDENENNVYSLPSIKEKKESNMKVKYINLGLFSGNTPNHKHSIQEIQITKDVHNKNFVNIVGNKSLILGLPMLSTLKNMQQVERKYIRNLSMQPNKIEKKRSNAQEITFTKVENFRVQYDDMKKNIIKREYNELLKKGRRPMSNKRFDNI